MHEHRYFYLECMTNYHNFYQLNRTIQINVVSINMILLTRLQTTWPMRADEFKNYISSISNGLSMNYLNMGFYQTVSMDLLVAQSKHVKRLLIIRYDDVFARGQ